MEMIPAFTDVLHVANITQDAQVPYLSRERIFHFSKVFEFEFRIL